MIPSCQALTIPNTSWTACIPTPTSSKAYSPGSTTRLAEPPSKPESTASATTCARSLPNLPAPTSIPNSCASAFSPPHYPTERQPVKKPTPAPPSNGARKIPEPTAPLTLEPGADSRSPSQTPFQPPSAPRRCFGTQTIRCKPESNPSSKAYLWSPVSPVNVGQATGLPARQRRRERTSHYPWVGPQSAI